MKTNLEVVNSPACFPPAKELPFCLQILGGKTRKKQQFLVQKVPLLPKDQPQNSSLTAQT